ncbi:MAG: DUF2934 domain-containing protein [Methylobacter sp.]|nr:MAG: DUF2934 domain-containing protein [Methylobacter sp.]
MGCKMTATVKNVQDDVSSDIKESGDAINFTDHDAKIAELAYYKAESRGFEPGRELDDWLEAEQELTGSARFHGVVAKAG